MTRKPSPRLIATVAVSLFVALALTGLLVSVEPDWFFDLIDNEGEPVREVQFPGPVETLLLLVIAGAFFAGSFFWLKTTARFSLVAVLLAVVAVQAAAYTSYEAWEYHESPEFCVRTCHVMEDTYLDFAEPGINQVMHAHQTNGTAECLDCHTGPGVKGQIDLMVVSARHVWKYTITHDYDPDNLGGDDGVMTVPDKNCEKCHGDKKEAELPEKHDRFETDCALCHSPHITDASGYFFPEIILEKEDCDKCHEERPLAMDNVTETGHTRVGDEDCRTCHQTHGLKDVSNVLACTDAGCHDDDAENEDSLVSLDHFLFELDAEECEQCHAASHNLTGPGFDVLSQYCQDCHDEGKPLAEGNLHLGVDEIGDDCSQCHGADPAPWNDDPGIASHGGLRCQECHVEGNDLDAPVPATTFTVQGQRDWMRENELGLAEWTTEGRGSHDPDADCNECHSPHDFSHPVYPDDETCDSTCHSWLQETFTAEGFPGVAGTPVYEGTLDPETLLQTVKDMDSDGRTHTSIMEIWGCTGFCHNPAMTLEIAEAWGVPLFAQNSGQTSVDPPEDLGEGVEHGFINKCTDCHRVERPGSDDPDDLHNTHITFVQGEQLADDQSGEFQDACAYCHSTNSPDDYHTGPGGGCYNCHLSGHLPETYYWGAE